jgi:hypothetical protein
MGVVVVLAVLVVREAVEKAQSTLRKRKAARDEK